MQNTIGGAPTATTTPLPAYVGSVNPTLDLLPIYQAANLGVYSISRNAFLGLASTPLGLTDTQSPTNKTFNNTNSLTITTANLIIQDSSDNTKQAQFVLSGLTTGTTRSYTLPNFNATLATLAGVETWTNKTLTSPTINAPTITNASMTIDTISGFTTAGSGTVYGIGVASGAFTTSNIIPTAGLQANAVTYAKLATTIFSGQLLTQANAGSAGGTMYYINWGGLKFLWGLGASQTTSAGGNQYTFTLPSAFFSTVLQGISGVTGLGTLSQQYAATVSMNTTTVTVELVSPGGAATAFPQIYIMGN